MAGTDAAIQTYLVGGAVRDELLGLPVNERDWVVTGADPQHLLDQGYRQVGSSFPVFLHPKSKEEYALARTERKQGHGYHGFAVNFDPGVSLEEDLERRDLTINAMARDSEGQLVDPYGGQHDIEHKLLRHVSPAFAEDPLRVLRVARFAARFAPMGFSVHADTLALMREITAAGELQHLVAERSWREIHKALGSAQPSAFLQTLRACDALAVLLPEVNDLYGVPQNPQAHPESDTGIHIELTLDYAASQGFSADVGFALLVHDLGKGCTAEADWPAHHGHEHTGLALVEAVCRRLKVPNACQRLALQVCAQHLRCHRVLEMRPAKVMNLLEALDALRDPDISQFVQACEADYRGRKGLQERPYPQAEFLQQAVRTVCAVRVSDLPSDKRPTGKALGEALRQARIAALAESMIQPDQ